MITSDDDLRLIGLAWRLDRLRWVPGAVLTDVVWREGTCLWVCTDEPAWRGEHLTDSQLAAWLCTGCPVQDECLELELRTAGEHTVGVWGALSADDRRAVHPHWLERGERAEDTDSHAAEAGPRR